MTKAEQNLIDDLNEFIRQTSGLIGDRAPSTGILPDPEIQVEQSVSQSVRFELKFAPEPFE